MESYRENAGCVDCYREHCRQQTPLIRVAATTMPDRRRPSRLGQIAVRRFDYARQSCRLFIAGSFVIGLILVPYTMSAPVKPPQSKQQSRQQTISAIPTGSQFWHNPCGGQETMSEGSGAGAGIDMMMGLDPTAVRREEDIIEGIRSSALNAMSHVEQFAGSFAVKTFDVSIQQLHLMFKETKLDWLRLSEYMPKELGENLTKSYMADLTFRNVLQPIYIGMQYIAVGLEQVAWDQEREGLPFAVYFNESTIKLKTILCEVSAAIYDMNIEMPETYVPRDIMPLESRTLKDRSLKSLRDWVIFRGYITSLEYMIEVFGYLQSSR